MSANLSKERSSLCSFSFADGRRYRTPRCPHPRHPPRPRRIHQRLRHRLLAPHHPLLLHATRPRTRPRVAQTLLSVPATTRARSSNPFRTRRHGPISCLQTRQRPPNLTPFRMNTCKRVSKQMTLTSFRMNTYEKHPGGRGVGIWVATIGTPKPPRTPKVTPPGSCEL
jgi:hypothetical protein